jgi:formylglycine-generating enzyme required for sulfatase activity
VSRSSQASVARSRPPTVLPVVTNGLGMRLAVVPAGTFLMGSPEADRDAFPDEKPPHPVRIERPFLLGVYPVTQGEFRAVTGRNPSKFQTSGRDTSRRPVESVSWQEAIEFCNALSEAEGLAPFYLSSEGEPIDPDADGYRLPTEAEWEYACRAGSKTRYYFGDDPARLRDHAWYRDNGESRTHTVGQKRPNAWGLYELHGNVWEWCWDGYDADYYAASPESDPWGPGQAETRVLRGGSWLYNALLARSANRYRLAPSKTLNDLGFRIARAAPVS